MHTPTENSKRPALAALVAEFEAKGGTVTRMPRGRMPADLKRRAAREAKHEREYADREARR